LNLALHYKDVQPHCRQQQQQPLCLLAASLLLQHCLAVSLFAAALAAVAAAQSWVSIGQS
jgi:hypothetical protein